MNGRSPRLDGRVAALHLLPVKMLLHRLWKLYQKCLAAHPVKTQVVSSGLIWGLGDVLAQTITRSTAASDRRRISFNLTVLMAVSHNKEECSFEGNLIEIGIEICQDDGKEFRINWKRVATTSLYGFGFVGPVGHFWYLSLDRLI